MKKGLVILFILPLFLSAQNNSAKIKNPASLDSIVYDLTPKTLAPREIGLPFSKFEILDARFDTSKLGFEYDRTVAFSYKNFKRIKLNGGVEKGIAEFYNDYYQLALGGVEDKLLIVLKKLWIDNLPNRQITENRNDIVRYSFQDIHIKFEYYLHRGNDYFALTRIDTVFQLTEEIIMTDEEKFKKNGMTFFNYSLKANIEKLNFNELAAGASVKRRLSITEIDSFNLKRFSLPILTASAYAKGVFINVNEFINNNPSVKKFKIVKKVLLMSDDENYKSRFYWGYSDGSGFHFSPSKKIDLFRVGNTFEFFIVDEIFVNKTTAGHVINLLLFSPGGDGTSYRFVNSPRQIDMETGEIY
jgi:hypothetical protein